MLAFTYKTKKELRDSIGKPLRFNETSMFGPEYRDDGLLTGVGPHQNVRKWYANVLMVNGLIAKVL
jgi:hypothetical protein